ncbi:MAG: anaerobic ribonucleoside-triphosphate reductase activating protein [Nanoarchaeota archaeon]
MEFSGIQKTSAIDFPGRLCSILFTHGCMFRCHYCHNPDLVFGNDVKQIAEDDILDELNQRKNLVSAVSITGGEATLHKGLPDFIKRLKDDDFAVKIDTNGTNPDVVKELLPMLDFIAMDVKAVDQEHYKQTVGVPVDFDKIKESIKLIMGSGKEYEFRTTVVPKLFPLERFEELGQLLKGSKKHVLQQFVNKKTLNPEYTKEAPYTKEELEQAKMILEKYVDAVEIRGI